MSITDEEKVSIEELKQLIEKERESNLKIQEDNKNLITKLSDLEKNNSELQSKVTQYLDNMFKFSKNESTIKDNDLSIDEKIKILQDKKNQRK